MITDKVFDIWPMPQALLSVARKNWTRSPSHCPQIIYELLDSGTFNAPDAIFTSSVSDYEVYTD